MTETCTVCVLNSIISRKVYEKSYYRKWGNLHRVRVNIFRYYPNETVSIWIITRIYDYSLNILVRLLKGLLWNSSHKEICEGDNIYFLYSICRFECCGMFILYHRMGCLHFPRFSLETDGALYTLFHFS